MTNGLTTRETTMQAENRAEFNDLLPDFKRFAVNKRDIADNIQRVRLKGVQYDGKYLNVTDSLRLLRINADYVRNLPEEAPFLYNVRDDEELDAGRYPDVTRLFQSEFRTEVYLSRDVLKAVRNALKDVHKETKGDKLRRMRVEFEDDVMLMQATDSGVGKREGIKEHNGRLRVIDGVEISGEGNTKFYVNSGFLSDALLTANNLLRYSKQDGITLKFNAHNRPIEITDGKMYEIIVMPIRVKA